MAWRSRGVSPEWRTATSSPKRARKRATSCGVSAISGTSTIDPRFASRADGDGAQVHLGLAGAGDAVEEERRRRARRASALGDGVDGRRLRRRGVVRARRARPARRRTDRPAPRAPRPSRAPASASRFTAARALLQRSSSCATGAAPTRAGAPGSPPPARGARPASSTRDVGATHCTRRAPTPRRLAEERRRRPAPAPSRGRPAAARGARPRRWARSSRSRGRAGRRAGPRAPRARSSSPRGPAASPFGGSPSRTREDHADHAPPAERADDPRAGRRARRERLGHERR